MGSDGLAGGNGSGDDALLESPALPPLRILSVLVGLPPLRVLSVLLALRLLRLLSLSLALRLLRVLSVILALRLLRVLSVILALRLLRVLSVLLTLRVLCVLSALAAPLILLALAARWRASAACLMRFDLLRLGSCANWLPGLAPRSRVLAALRMRSDLRGADGAECSKESSWLALAFAGLLVMALLARDERTGGCDVAARFRRAILGVD